MTLFANKHENNHVSDDFPLGIRQGADYDGRVVDLPPLSEADREQLRKLQADLTSVGEAPALPPIVSEIGHEAVDAALHYHDL